MMINIKEIEKIEEELKCQEEEINQKEKNIEKNLEIEVIYHLGDIHIPGTLEREEEYEKVLNKTIEMINMDKRKKMAIICGDLFHDKTKPYQEANILARNFMQGLGDIIETVIIQGNHDINIDNENRKDSIKSALLQLKTKYPIHYLTENKIYKIQGINFGLTKMTNELPTPIGIKNLFELYIGLYHGTLYKSRTDEGYEFNNQSKIKGSDFKDYNIVMLGDIHKYQYLNKEKTIAYSGSLVQQNFGETINNHGMLLWDLKTKTSKLMEVPNDYIYKTHLITDIKNYEIPDIANKLCRLRILYKGVERLDLIKYEKEIKTRYNIIQFVKQEITEDIKINKNMKEEEILNKKFMDIYRDFLIKNNLNENQKVSEMLEKIIDEEQKKVSKEKKEIKIRELEFENLLTYGSNNKINFDKLGGINILAGINGLGKSSLIDIILFTIYNECSKGEGKDILNIRHDKGYGILRLELNGEKYTIYRGINKGKTNVCLLKEYVEKQIIYNELKKIENEKRNKSKEKNNVLLKEDKEKNICDSGKFNIEKQIKTLFGEYEDMIMTSVILQNGTNFIDLDYKDQKQILTNILGLNLFENVKTFSSQKHRNYTTNILKMIEKEITNIDYNNLIENETNLLNEIDKNLKNKNQEQYDLLKDKHIIEYKLNDDRIINIEKIINEKEILEEKNIKFNEQMESLNLNEKIKLEEEKNNYEKKMEQIQIIINELTKEIKKSSSDNKEKLKKEKILLEKNISILNDNVNNFNENINELSIKNNEILKTLLINNNEINSIKKEYENNKRNILKKINDKKILEKSINLQKENNKELLKHIFSDTCECCKTNKIIHEQIGYLEKIIKLQKEMEAFKCDEKDINLIDEKILLLKDYENNINDINVNKLKIETLENKLKLEKKNILLIEENINININNDAINEKIKEQKKILLNNKKQLDDIKEYEKILNEYNKNSIKIQEYENIINIYEKNIENIVKLNEIKKNEKQLNEEIKKINEQKKNILNNIFKFETEKIKQEKLQSEYKVHQETTNIYKEILNLFDNGFTDYVMAKQLNILEKKMNNMINSLAGYEIKIKIENKNIKFYKLSKKHNKITTDEDLDVIDDTKDINLKSLCGYEKIIFNISLRLALNNMNTIIKNNFIIIDESFSGADSINIHKFSHILDIIKKEYDMCIIISHIDEIKNQKGNIIKIQYNKNTYDSNINII
jgi:DNA repair exonuclease SbcCD ATPase subunit